MKNIWGTIGVFFLCLMLMVFVFAVSRANAAETLPIVSPPTDWMGVGVIGLLVFVLVVGAGYIIHIKKTPGLQLGEAEINRIADLLHFKQQQAGVIVTTSDPLFYDEIQFKSQEELDKYKSAQAIMNSFKK